MDLYKNYNFSTLAPQVLGLNYTGQKLMGLVDFSMAVQYQPALEQIYQNIRVYLPPLQQIDPKVLTYAIFKKGNEQIVLATNWLTNVYEDSDDSFVVRIEGSEEVKKLFIEMAANMDIEYSFL